jgi:hypothetical protein
MADGTEQEICTVSGCDVPAERTLEWPEPGGLVAVFCDEHAEQKLSISRVRERPVDTDSDHTERER